jgi:hypothetical protein
MQDGFLGSLFKLRAGGAKPADLLPILDDVAAPGT